MKEEKIEIRIAADGSIHGDVIKGPGGQGCLDILDEVLSDVGEKTKTKKTDKFYQLRVGTNGVKVSN